MKYQEFLQTFEKQMARISSEVRAFPWEDAEAYGNWCAQTFHYVCHSTRLLALSSARTPLDRNDFHYRFAKHLQEESGHDNLALRDVKALGFEITKFPELSQTSAFYQTQYYNIEHLHAFAFFGYILMLEGTAVKCGPEICQRAEKIHGGRAVNFIRVHSEEDQGHVKEALRWLEKMSPAELQCIHTNFLSSCDNYIAMMHECVRRSATWQKAG